jgi:hypothetical protein
MYPVTGKMTTLTRIVGLGFMIVGLTSCGAVDQSTAGSSSGAEAGAIRAEDPATGIGFELSGRSLSVEVMPDAPRETEALFARPVNVVCGTKEEFGPYGASAQALNVTPTFVNGRMTVLLSKDISRNVAFCGIESVSGSSESYAFFIPVEELVPTVGGDG